MKSNLRKISLITSIVTGIAALVFAVLDFIGVMESAYTISSFLFAVTLLLQAAAYWKENRKTAIIDLVLGAILFVLAVANALL